MATFVITVAGVFSLVGAIVAIWDYWQGLRLDQFRWSSLFAFAAFTGLFLVTAFVSLAPIFILPG
jgi:hypothetical protein